jgi:hypothetical protein
MTTFLTALLGTIILALTYWAFHLSVEGLPPDRRRLQRLGYGLFAVVALLATMGVAVYDWRDKQDSARDQETLQHDLDEANRKLSDSERREVLMTGQLQGLGFDVRKISSRPDPTPTFIDLAAAVKRIADQSGQASTDPTGLYSVSINGIPNQRIRLDKKIDKY